MSNKIKSLSYGSIALLQPLQKWLNDGRVSEVMLNKQKEVWIEKNGILTKHEVPELGARHLACLFQLLANENKQRISQENPLLSGSLPDGSRVQLCLPPTAKDYCFAIRRQVVTDLSLDDYDNSFFYCGGRETSESLDPPILSFPQRGRDTGGEGCLQRGVDNVGGGDSGSFSQRGVGESLDPPTLSFPQRGRDSGVEGCLKRGVDNVGGGGSGSFSQKGVSESMDPPILSFPQRGRDTGGEGYLQRGRDTGVEGYLQKGGEDFLTYPYKLNPESKLSYLYKTKNYAEFIKLAIILRKNIVISGGTSSGKTTYLNACIKYIPKDQRLILLEDTRELKISHDNYVSLLASKGEQSRANITMQDLVQCALRLRPDRIIMGEIRGKEIMDFVSACSTGHDGSLTSIHANSPTGAFMRMVQLYKLNSVPSMRDEEILAQLKSVIDIVIQLNKTSRGRCVGGVYFKGL